MQQTAAQILAVQEVSQVILVTAQPNDVLRAAVRPTAPVNPSVEIAMNVSAYQFIFHKHFSCDFGDRHFRLTSWCSGFTSGGEMRIRGSKER
jgi:hypothetical protein